MDRMSQAHRPFVIESLPTGETLSYPEGMQDAHSVRKEREEIHGRTRRFVVGPLGSMELEKDSSHHFVNPYHVATINPSVNIGTPFSQRTLPFEERAAQLLKPYMYRPSQETAPKDGVVEALRSTIDRVVRLFRRAA